MQTNTDLENFDLCKQNVKFYGTKRKSKVFTQNICTTKNKNLTEPDQNFEDACFITLYFYLIYS